MFSASLVNVSVQTPEKSRAADNFNHAVETETD
jgi:hypothetical protein